MIITRDYAGSRLDRWVCSFLNLPHSLASKLIRKGSIKINGKRAEISTRLAEGDEVFLPNSVKITPKEAKKGENFVSDEMLADFKASIIFENEDFFAINKPSGLATQGGTKIKLSVDDFLSNLSDEYRLVHRLDKETSGVLIIAKNRASASKIAGDFREKAIKKVYLAIVWGVLPQKQGTINAGLEKVGMNVEVSGSGLESVTHYSVLKEKDGFSLLEIEIETGRMHQIRVHLGSLGCKIVGDEKYGDVTSDLARKIAPKMLLHAYKITYNNRKIIAEIPNYFKNAIKNLDK
jgi:23S rRNA pseudouridine955/2504/2580 synthase